MEKSILWAVAALLLVPSGLKAQSSLDPFRPCLDEILDDSGDDRKVDQFVFHDVNGDGREDLVLASYDLGRITAYSATGDAAAPAALPLSAETVKSLKGEDVYFSPIAYLYSLSKNDHLSKLKPLFIWDVDFAGNRFSTSVNGESDGETGAKECKKYKKILFKTNVGDVTYAGKEDSPKEHYDFDLVWKLDDPEFVKTGFRGYKAEEAAPLLFRDGFQKTLNVLKFSRWKKGEAIRSVNEDVKDIVSSYYRGEKIAGIRYVADCPENERSWYRVVFSRKGDMSHTALVCIAEGGVASVWDEYMDVSEFGASPSDLWYGGSLQEFWNYKQVEFMAMWGSPEGLEIAVRWPSMEGVHYSILREYGTKMLLVYDDYEYIMAY